MSPSLPPPPHKKLDRTLLFKQFFKTLSYENADISKFIGKFPHFFNQFNSFLVYLGAYNVSLQMKGFKGVKVRVAESIPLGYRHGKKPGSTRVELQCKPFRSKIAAKVRKNVRLFPGHSFMLMELIGKTAVHIYSFCVKNWSLFDFLHPSLVSQRTKG